MFPIVDQTVGPNGLNFCVDTHASLGLHGLKNQFFPQGQSQALQLVIYKLKN